MLNSFPIKPISAVIITNNESENIVRTLKALQQVTDDIVVVDSGSTDDTMDLATAMGASVFAYGWKGYAQNKNFCNSQCQHEWILSIDADEVLSDELIQSIQSIDLQDDTIYLLDRITNFCGTWIRYCGWYPDWKPRLFQRGKVQWQGDFVHETLAIPSHFKKEKLQGKLYHYSFKSLDDHLERLERYADLSAQELYAKGKKASFFLLTFSPLWRFFKTYILKLGFLDGKNGYLISQRNAYMVRQKYRKLKILNDEDHQS